MVEESVLVSSKERTVYDSVFFPTVISINVFDEILALNKMVAKTPSDFSGKVEGSLCIDFAGP